MMTAADALTSDPASARLRLRGAAQVDPAPWTPRGPRALHLWDPRAFTEHDLRAFWRFRARFVALKPEVDPARDYRSFVDFIRSADLAWVWVDRDGAILGTAFHRLEARRVDGREVVVVHSEYGYCSVRGRAEVILSTVAAYAWAAIKARQAVYVGGFAYPQGYLIYARTLPSVWLLGQESMPAAERALAAELAREWGGAAWDVERQRVSFNTLHREAPRPSADPERQALLAGYEALNPEWRAGYGLMMLTRLDLVAVPKILGRMAARARRR